MYQYTFNGVRQPYRSLTISTMEDQMRKYLIIIGLILVANGLFAGTVFAAEPPAGPPSSGSYHLVRYGETLASIGYHYGVNAYTICRANSLANCNYIYTGQRLYIPSSPSYYHQPSHYSYGCSTSHIIQYGET